MRDETDESLAELHAQAAALPPRERDELRERIALFRTMLEITGCATIREALEQIQIWKGQASGHPKITAN